MIFELLFKTRQCDSKLHTPPSYLLSILNVLHVSVGNFRCFPG